MRVRLVVRSLFRMNVDVSMELVSLVTSLLVNRQGRGSNRIAEGSVVSELCRQYL